MHFAFIAVAFSFFAFSADSAMAQGKGNWKANKQDRKEYRQEVKQARKEYRQDVREARKDYRQDRRQNRANGRYSTTRPYGRAYGYRNVRPYVGNRRTTVRQTRRGYIVRQIRRMN